MIVENFASRLRQLRLTNSITQKALGDAVGITKQAVCDIERSRRTTTMENLISIADFFDVSIDYLVGRTDNPEVNR